MADIKIEPVENYGLSKKDRPKSQFGQIGVVGCGSTGQSIVLMAASKGIDVVFLELTQEKIDEARKEMETELNNRINRWGMTDGEKRAIMSRVKGTLYYEDFKDCDIVIEAILSKTREKSREIRKEIFKNIEKYVKPHAIIATNSSTMVITEFAAELQYKERCISLHISTSNPDATVVEIAKGLYTSDEVIALTQKFAGLIEKSAIPVQESPGLISARLVVPLINEACDILMEGVGKMEDIDYVMRNSLGLALGPFELADKIGIDRLHRWMENLYEEFGDQKYKASPVIKRLVRAQRFGRKAGEGFYKYDQSGKKSPVKTF